ncbi:NAD(P)-dependent dehydrogenase (short-subunit alcohol dehydrogenase family) [Natronocella acetinitrilica]|uniref:NAD(P)-dependent dehydrogenase (Short-subunit alcohol dehydrogenase family) n=1 Tax=Natronocella acetinitrilica TaxID=414046 RepID=A0AAE3KCA5_9GAMM|nr:SDR family oxidoreductase [Natronocella acetinitrilica]MCP1675559.1 NAD(P)-dependent dehydrogenase (short-subunit alcohol dehydrogenase family) [Natronocella acetinitrilica]
MFRHFPDQFTALIQGASRGIGLETVRQLLNAPQTGLVIATSRDPQASAGLQALADQHGERLVLVSMDVSDPDAIAQAADAVAQRIERLHLLYNVTGILHDNQGLSPEKQLADVRANNLEQSFRVNAMGPMLVAQAFSPLMLHGAPAVLANMSARVGSITDNRLGGWYAYRAAKAAQNMFTRGLSVELGRKSKALAVVALHPGTTDTELSAPFQKRVPSDKLFSVERTARQLLEIIAELEGRDTGRFIAWDGADIPW